MSATAAWGLLIAFSALSTAIAWSGASGAWVALAILVYICQLITSVIGAMAYVGAKRKMSAVEVEGGGDDRQGTP